MTPALSRKPQQEEVNWGAAGAEEPLHGLQRSVAKAERRTFGRVALTGTKVSEVHKGEPAFNDESGHIRIYF